jgi:RNA polymerase sigma-70 factor (ECF subfamily)
MDLERDHARPEGQDQLLTERSRTFRAALTRYFRRRLPGASDIEDLVQEVFLRIVKRGDSDQLDQFGSYMFQTAANVMKDRRRRRQVREADLHISLEPDLHAAASPDPERVILGQEALRATTRKLMSLPERARRVFALRRLEGLPIKDIAERLGVSPSTVEKDLQKIAEVLLSEEARR